MAEDLEKQLLQTRRTLEKQIQDGTASCNVQDALDLMQKIRKDDGVDDALIQRGEA